MGWEDLDPFNKDSGLRAGLRYMDPIEYAFGDVPSNRPAKPQPVKDARKEGEINYDAIEALVDKILGANSAREAKIDRLNQPLVGLRDQSLVDLARYRRDPAAFTKAQYGYKEGEDAGVSDLENTAAARGDFLGDASKKRISRFKLDYLSGKSAETFNKIAATLQLGQQGVTGSQAATMAFGGMNQNAFNQQIATQNQNSSAVQQAILAAAGFRNAELLQRDQNIANRQSATINATGDILASLPYLAAV
jgi:hypothetical protein